MIAIGGQARLGAMTKNGRGIQSVEVGHRLLAVLVEAGKPMILRDLAAGARLTPAQAHAYLASFRRIELVEQHPVSGKYSIGPLAMRLGMARIRSYEPLARASQAAIDISQQLGLMVCVLVWGPHAPTVIQVQEGAHQLSLNIHEGTIFSVTGTASGRLFGALSKAEVVRLRMEAELSGSVVDQSLGQRYTRDEVKAEFAAIRKRGYAVTHGKPIPGINAVSAPVFDIDGELLLALTVIGSEKTLPLGKDDPTPGVLLGFARNVSGRAGDRN